MKFLLTGFLLLAQLHLSAQTLKIDDIKNLSVSWEVVSNDLAAEKPGMSIITFTNKGSQPFPGQGWSIYFNSANFKVTDPSKGTINLANGDLQVFKPGSKFGNLQPGETRKVEVSHDPLRNISEFPQGFYLTFDNNPAKGFPVQVDIKPFNSLKNDLIVANRVYQQNARIENLAPEKLIKVFPTPVTYNLKNQKFILDAATSVMADAVFKNEEEHLVSFLTQLTGSKPLTSTGTGKMIRRITKGQMPGP